MYLSYKADDERPTTSPVSSAWFKVGDSISTKHVSHS